MPFEPRFGRAADAYKDFRPDYPPELFAGILAAVAPERRNCAIDLGAGTGKLTAAIAERFAETIAVEPDPQMALKLRERVPRAAIQIAKAEDLERDPASVDLITIAAAFHWMSADNVVAKAETWLRPGGILAICGGRFPKTPQSIREIVRVEFNEHWNQFRDTRLDTANSSVCARDRLPGSFCIVADRLIRNEQPLTAAGFCGFCRSTSYGSAYAETIPDSAAYWRGLEERFREAWPDETFPVDFSVWLLLAKKD